MELSESDPANFFPCKLTQFSLLPQPLLCMAFVHDQPIRTNIGFLSGSSFFNNRGAGWIQPTVTVQIACKLG